MARFVRDEKRTYPFTWLVIGSLFAASAGWAVYAEMSSRVPWQEHQKDFYEQELVLADQALGEQQASWQKRTQEEPLKGQMARFEALKEQKNSGAYAEAFAKLQQLNSDFVKAELKKTFGASDLDEAYYYRNLEEYKRDAAQVAVRQAYAAAYPDDPGKARTLADAIYADPSPPDRGKDDSVAVHHLLTEVHVNTEQANRLEEARGQGGDKALLDALKAAHALQLTVVRQLDLEVQHQRKIDTALAEMAAIRGPSSPRVTVDEPAKREEALLAARKKVCEGKEQTQNCLSWLVLEPVDKEFKQLEVTIAKARRPLLDAELRQANAKMRAKPAFNPGDMIGSLVGPLEIKQVVTHWMAYERDVDIEQVDRCQTCHMGVNSGQYTDVAINPLFRTHPRRDMLMRSHSIDKFGCTVCHQGQGRATSDLAHSGWHLELHHGEERWHFAGDHYWEDPMLSVGHLTKVVIDDQNDTLEVKIGKAKKATLTLEHGVLATEAELLGAVEGKLKEAVAASKDSEKWRAVVRVVENRFELGIVTDDAAEAASAKKPAVSLFFPKVGTAEMLGFGRIQELKSKSAQLHRAPLPMMQPVRAGNAEAQGVFTAKQYAPPDGGHGLQVPDEMRNRFIEGMPEIEAGCLRCHGQDTDLRPRASEDAYIRAKLARQKAEADFKADPAAYAEAHGSGNMPAVPEDPSSLTSLAPTLDDGRQLFRQLNCTGCHLLEGYENNEEQGPALDHVAAKVTPEWLLTWLRDPRGWRAKTSMPNLWPRPLDPASKLPYPQGSPEYVKWEAAMREETVAVAAFLVDRADNPAGGATLRDTIAGYADVPGADADEGKKVFEAYGCQGCHADTDDAAKLPEAWRNRERDIAPTLSNLAGKTSADWIAYWAENPARYWHGTSMPNLRLTRKEAASVGKYLASRKSDTPRAAKVSTDDLKLVTDAKAREQMMACGVAGGTMMSRVDCGRRVIEHRGCYGCHNMSGFGGLAPIGPELSGFAKKDVTTLDFGYAISDHHLQTMETFATLKLDSPRIYGRDRIELKMGDFDLSAEEIRALVIFLKGTVPAKPNKDFDPMEQPAYASAIRGRKLVNDLNCRGCHMIEGWGADVDGFRSAQLSRDAQLRAPFLTGEGARVQPEWLFSFLRDPQANGIRPWLHPEWAWGDEVPDDKLALRMPTFNLTPEQWTDIVRYFASWDNQPYPYQVPAAGELSKTEKLWAMKNMNSAQTGNCLSCHFYGEFPVDRGKGDILKMAPNLANVQRRLRPVWVESWLLRPQSYLPYTKMIANFATVDRPGDAQYWPKENDPFLSPSAIGWDLVPELGKMPTSRQARIIRDMLFSFPNGAPWPAKGAEASSVMVDPEAAKLQATADGEPAAADNGAAAPAGPQTGAVPARRRTF